MMCEVAAVLTTQKFALFYALKLKLALRHVDSHRAQKIRRVGLARQHNHFYKLIKFVKMGEYSD